MDQILYSISADTDVSDLHTELLPYGAAKFLYDRWNADPKVYNVVMYRYVDGEKTIYMPKL